MARILVVLPDPVEAKLLDRYLRTSGHTPVLAATGHEGVAAAKGSSADLVVLDWAIPDMTYAEAIRGLGSAPETRSVPVVALSHKTDEVDRIVGFELGAADYVTKPYSVRELVLRINAILRRARPDPRAASIIDLGRLRIDRAGYRVWVDDREVELTLLELNLLLALYEGRSRVQTRAALLEGVWGMDASITTRTVDTHVKRLRDKLGPLGQYVETVRGIGYRLADIRPLQDESA